MNDFESNVERIKQALSRLESIKSPSPEISNLREMIRWGITLSANLSISYLRTNERTKKKPKRRDRS